MIKAKNRLVKLLYEIVDWRSQPTLWLDFRFRLVQSQKAEIFQVGKRPIKNHQMIDNWGNAKIALLLQF